MSKGEVLTELKPYVLLAEGHALAEKTELTPRDLAGHPMILLDARPSSDYFQSILSDAGIKPNIAYRSSSFEMVRGMVGHGLGYSLLATKPASSMTHDGRALVTRPLIASVRPSRVVLATRKGATLSATAEKFACSCRDVLGIGA